MALMPVADALAAILAGAAPLPEEMIALDDAWHRVLAPLQIYLDDLENQGTDDF